MKQKILVFGAHPDDCEIGMGGTIKKLSNSGYDVTIIDLTKAEMSSNGNIFTRQVESQKAMKILGASQRMNLDIPDRDIKNTKKNIEKIANCIRQQKPHMVFYPSSIDKHPDHVAASHLIQEAIFHAKLRKFETDCVAYTVPNCYRYHINDITTSDFYVDITETFDIKMQALRAYESQFFTEVEKESTRLTNGFLDFIASANRSSGYECGVSYAEGFISVKPILLSSVESLEAISND